MTHRTLSTILLCAVLLSSALAFAPSVAVIAPTKIASIAKSSTPLEASPLPVELFTSHAQSSSTLLSLGTLDPTTILSNTLGGLLGSSLILAVPIVAALSIAGLIAFLIVSYANPADEDD
mmetsp:Transcript_28648/g.46503  ORF Transcript_28648/g.46503 Transcript_28648/m.46503 type:complete len:120 (+) Transcript_28648:65-424(+)|eukprot:CAMPEP_0196145138 /NCGR_PEP_ID=MMETSP0910-20130528/19277_1 /TAXON_ID=49265 /ORGANISM="Thalassiosira rotula, Strain GSO102" /LENGTH=119 /DNA_ID=CAMNT_0041407003 /DNA_START=56 /DNA_END=415 /DNA_ORIENTATION=-